MERRRHEFTATAYGAPTKRANASSNAWTRGPVESHPDSSVATTSSISSRPMAAVQTAPPRRRSTSGALQDRDRRPRTPRRASRLRRAPEHGGAQVHLRVCPIRAFISSSGARQRTPQGAPIASSPSSVGTVPTTAPFSSST